MTTGDLSQAIGTALPYLRRYARALTGSQSTGDNYAAATLEAILADRSTAAEASSPKAGLFKVFHGIWVSTGAPVVDESESAVAKAQARLSRLTTNSREALLLHSIEDFSLAEVAEIMQIERAEAEQLVILARQEMADAVTGRVLIIEDEAIIAMDLESIVSDLGHKVTGVARTRSAAVDLAASETPDLVLADIQLADNSSGIDAVNDILESLGDRPVIFITAFPERLLTGERPEPAFLISKPYSEEQVRSAVSQAMFFSSTETLRA
ncbi:two-component response regulator [Salipiger aestuarii]|uniref:CheY-like chemotaxis protein n=1 Tax=Salipiger aestuarii TaxID=568098 RepID=A0A327XJU0_9RHOB|nr:response regulator [Salipiger aestuarii]EIE52096.1 two-component response regulator [Citreicella sp. 357]KAA8605263.1 two-component response regulator [Salipiger aestuarii]KAA8607443.1 two-component response regulator [Salipiger aestuarii]KAB2537415.1 two-component response regulator [Salipiger aestuarii]RAK09428.1 CheY-like chemotaxis protein [Salipiger aestuarii]